MLKNSILLFFLFISAFSLRAQNLYLKIEGSTEDETKITDSIPYIKRHENAKSVSDEADKAAKNLLFKGYLESRITSYNKINDSTFIYRFSVGKKTKYIHIYTGNLSDEEKQLLSIEKDTLILTTEKVESFMNTALSALEKKGYSLSSLQLTDFSAGKTSLNAVLKMQTEKKRTLDGLVIEGYKKFPEGIRRNILKQYKNRIFNQETLQRIYNDFSGIRFVSQARYPEILFKTDSTKVYVYLEKANANSFDGFVGFSNDENSKLVFNGYLDLMLNNVLNSGEKFNLFWKSDGNQQTTFNTSLELPYVFKSPIGLKAALRIFKQDSTFQNTMTDINIGYYFSYNSKLYLGHQQTKSVDIQNTNNSLLSDFTNSFWTSTYEFTGYNIEDLMFPERTYLLAKAGTGKRKTKLENTAQYFAQLNLHHNIYLNRNNIINIKNETFYLNSSNYIVNELHRFGGINSIRGFNENSLQANLYSAVLAEYRYILSQGIYVHSITDYGYFQDETAQIKDNLLGFGFGLGLFTKNGLFNIIYANGSTKGQQIKLSNSIVHVSFKARF